MQNFTSIWTTNKSKNGIEIEIVKQVITIQFLSVIERDYEIFPKIY